MATTDKQRADAKTFLAESDGDLGVALVRLLTRIIEIEHRLQAHIADVEARGRKR